MKSWDLTGSPQSTLWSPMGCNQGSPEGSSQEEPSPPATPGKKGQDSWLKTTYDVVGGGMFENIMKPNNERGNYSNYFQSSNKSCDIEQLCSYQSLIQDQIRAIEVRQQHHVLFVPIYCLLFWLAWLCLTVICYPAVIVVAAQARAGSVSESERSNSRADITATWISQTKDSAISEEREW